MMNGKLGVLLLGLSGTFFVACGEEEGSPEPRILVEDPWARAMPLPEGGGEYETNSALYFTVRNEGRGGDRLTGGTTPVARALEVHESYLEDDLMKMRKVGSLELPPSSRIEFEPGGLHIMLLGLSRPLAAGEEFEVTLQFDVSGPTVVPVPVLGPGGR
ncbi:MAG: copper chaperone PCu(A)C [Gemmatimonadetes bacterium]|nr:copper chaperone PCu(A)C [Gemmatimonadota bacterium]NNM06179.1 copper chaperone PCu(A)C [Gemmatimonadota bacterium]